LSTPVERTPTETRPIGLCPICSESRFSRVFSVADPLFAPSKLTLERCTGCDLVVLNPRLAERAIKKLEEVSTVYDIRPDEVDERLRGLDGVLEWLEASVTRRSHLLDIGCNRGFLLEAARRRGWDDVVGVELSDAAAGRARRDFGLTVHGTLEAVGHQLFDLVVAWHVLEHTLDPVDFLKTASSHLAPEGILAIQVPSFDALSAFVDRGIFGSLVCAVHNFYFERRSLTNAIASAGLTVVDVVEEDIMLTATCVRQAGRLTYFRDRCVSDVRTPVTAPATPT
jgi:SAM-dependent methyltransferase